jgi:hypothetical protein
MRLIDNAWRDFHRLWTIRISLAVGLFNGIAAVLGAFTDVFNPWFLVVLSIIVNVGVIPLARLAKQREPEPATPEAGGAA